MLLKDRNETAQGYSKHANKKFTLFKFEIKRTKSGSLKDKWNVGSLVNIKSNYFNGLKNYFLVVLHSVF